MCGFDPKTFFFKPNRVGAVPPNIEAIDDPRGTMMADGLATDDQHDVITMLRDGDRTVADQHGAGGCVKPTRAVRTAQRLGLVRLMGLGPARPALACPARRSAATSLR